MPTSLDDLNSKLFREQLNTKFSVHAGGQLLPLELVEVAEETTAKQMDCFSLYFLGPFNPRLPQQIHRLEHEKLGTLEIFLTAISADGKGTMYEAVFHRFRKKT